MRGAANTSNWASACVSVSISIWPRTGEQGIREAAKYYEENMKMFGELRLVRALTDEQIEIMRDPRRAPTAKLPRIEDAIANGGVLCGSPEQVIEHLKSLERRYPGLDRVSVSLSVGVPQGGVSRTARMVRHRGHAGLRRGASPRARNGELTPHTNTTRPAGPLPGLGRRILPGWRLRRHGVLDPPGGAACRRSAAVAGKAALLPTLDRPLIYTAVARPVPG